MRTLQNRSKGKEKTSDQKVGGSNPSRHAISSSYPMSLSRRELNSTVVNIELTLVSIIQGVALYFLTENARTALSLNNWPALLYISAGLCRSEEHTSELQSHSDLVCRLLLEKKKLY